MGEPGGVTADCNSSRSDVEIPGVAPPCWAIIRRAGPGVVLSAEEVVLLLFSNGLFNAAIFLEGDETFADGFSLQTILIEIITYIYISVLISGVHKV